MNRRRCKACDELFYPHRNVPDQQYCSKPECQGERRRRWQQEKRKRDPDYRANQAAAQKRWGERNRDYWRNYRRRHPEYAARNREQQRKRNRDRVARGPSSRGIAKMDVCKPQIRIDSGTYRLIPVAGAGIAKSDEYIVEMHLLSGT